MMKTLFLRAATLAIVPAMTAFCAAAQVDLTALSLTARSHESVVSWQERDWRPAGLTEVVHVPGHVLIDVRAVFDGPWSETLERVQVNVADIRLVLPDGSELAPLGGYPTWGQLTLQTRTLSGRRPRDFPTTDADIYWNGLFRVPKAVSQAVLRIGGEARFEGVIAIPAPSAQEDAASFASFRVTGVRRFRVAQLSDGRDAAQMTSTITALPGHLLAEIEVEVTGLATNNVDGSERFNWHTHDFRLVDAQGTTLALVGERFMQRVLDSQFNGTNIGSDAERRMLWLVPEGLTEARLLFGETEVARVALGTAGATETD